MPVFSDNGFQVIFEGQNLDWENFNKRSKLEDFFRFSKKVGETFPFTFLVVRLHVKFQKKNFPR